MVVDVQIARGADGHVDQRMARQLVQHVIEEADAGLVVVGAGAVEVDLDGNIGLGGLAGDLGSAHPIFLVVRRAYRRWRGMFQAIP